jgi:hypothetical protein
MAACGRRSTSPWSQLLDPGVSGGLGGARRGARLLARGTELFSWRSRCGRAARPRPRQSRPRSPRNVRLTLRHHGCCCQSRRRVRYWDRRDTQVPGVNHSAGAEQRERLWHASPDLARSLRATNRARFLRLGRGRRVPEAAFGAHASLSDMTLPPMGPSCAPPRSIGRASGFDGPKKQR